MARPVLVATDLSDLADEAIRQAEVWARRLEAPLAVCHVLASPLGLGPLYPQVQAPKTFDLLELTTRAKDAVVQRVTDLTGRRPAELRVAIEDGVPYAEI